MDVYAAHLMTTPPVSISPDATAETAANRMESHDIGSIVVESDNNELVGIITTRDFVTVTASGTPPEDVDVSDIMTTNVISTTADERITELADMMMYHDIHHVPIIDDDATVLGILSATDLTNYIVDKPLTP